MINKRLGKLILIVILFSAVIYGIYWLWQRQPKTPTAENKQPSMEQIKPSQNTSFVKSPKDSQVLSSKNAEFQGKVEGEAFIVIIANSTSAIGKSEKNGEFKIPVELSVGLNLLDIQVFDNNLNATGSEQKTIYVTAEDKPLPQNWQVYAGSVKIILDNLITLTTQAGEKKVKTDVKTNIVLPSPALSKKSTPEPDSVRIGDFAIALGEVKDDVLNAQDLEIIRENKPQIPKKISIAKILTPAKTGKFSAKQNEENKIFDFTLDKNSRILNNGQAAKDTDIQKNLNAIIVYQDKDDKRLVDLVYLL